MTCSLATAASAYLLRQGWRITETVMSLWIGRRGSRNLQIRPLPGGALATRAPSPGRAWVPRPSRPSPGRRSERPRPPVQGLEPLAPGWRLSASEGVGLGGLGGYRPALLHGRVQPRPLNLARHWSHRPLSDRPLQIMASQYAGPTVVHQEPRLGKRSAKKA